MVIPTFHFRIGKVLSWVKTRVVESTVTSQMIVIRLEAKCLLLEQDSQCLMKLCKVEEKIISQTLSGTAVVCTVMIQLAGTIGGGGDF